MTQHDWTDLETFVPPTSEWWNSFTQKEIDNNAGLIRVWADLKTYPDK